MEFQCIYLVEDGSYRMIGSSDNPVKDIDVTLRRKFPRKNRTVYIFPVIGMEASMQALRAWLHKNDYIIIGKDEIINIERRHDMIRIMDYMASLSTDFVPTIVGKNEKLSNIIELDQVYRSRRRGFLCFR